MAEFTAADTVASVADTPESAASAAFATLLISAALTPFCSAVATATSTAVVTTTAPVGDPRKLSTAVQAVSVRAAAPHMVKIIRNAPRAKPLCFCTGAGTPDGQIE